MVTNTVVAICAWRTKKVVNCNLYLPVPSSNNLTTLLSSLQSLLGILHYFCCAFIASRWPHIFPLLLVESVPYCYLFSLSRARLRTAASSTARQAPILMQVRSPPIVILLRWEAPPVWPTILWWTWSWGGQNAQLDFTIRRIKALEQQHSTAFQSSGERSLWLYHFTQAEFERHERWINSRQFLCHMQERFHDGQLCKGEFQKPFYEIRPFFLGKNSVKGGGGTPLIRKPQIRWKMAQKQCF